MQFGTIKTEEKGIGLTRVLIFLIPAVIDRRMDGRRRGQPRLFQLGQGRAETVATMGDVIDLPVFLLLFQPTVEARLGQGRGGRGTAARTAVQDRN